MERESDRVAASPATDPFVDGLDDDLDDDDDVSLSPGPAGSDDFSSCDGSDLDRYCSANSALGTPSLCGSVGHHADLLLLLPPPHLDSHLANGRNHHPADDGDSGDDSRTNRRPHGGGLDPRSCDGGLDCSPPGGKSRCPSPRHLAPFDLDRMRSLPRIRTGSALVISRPDREDPSPSSHPGGSDGRKGAGAGGVENGDSDQGGSPSVPTRAEGMTHFVEDPGRSSPGSASDDHFPSGRASEEADDGASSRCQGSVGEDSMLGYGTEDEGQRRVHDGNKWWSSKHEQAAVPENDHPLLLNSSVAYGSDDWDEFMQETGEHGLQSLSLYEDQPAQQQIEPPKSNENPPSPAKNHGGDLDPDRADQEEEDVREIPAVSCQFQANVLSSQNERTNIVWDPLSDHEDSGVQKPLSGESLAEGRTNVRHNGPRKEISFTCSEEVPAIDAGGASQNRAFGESAPCSTSTGLQSISSSHEAFQSNEGWTQEDDNASPSPWITKSVLGSGVHILLEGNSDSTAVVEEDLVPEEVMKLDSNDSYDEMFLEMEEILLDSGKSHEANFALANVVQRSHHFRDGSSTASTSGTDEAYPLHQFPSKIDRVEVVGAKQKKGDVSFGERLVGVKEYTVYTLRVWSCKDQWEVERRYRDFFALYRHLRTLFTDYGLTLPSPWSNVERESRKLFGNASPTVVSDRSTLIQECLHSILNSRYPFGTPSPLVVFLSPGKGICDSDMLKSLIPKSLRKLREDRSSTSSNSKENCPEDFSSLGKTISLVVEIKPYKSIRQLLESQHYRCAGCHMHLDAGKTLLRELVQTFGWNKPRFCEYTGQLFCASCHSNDTAVLPARVLRHWDFSLYPVSQLAKAYLESIHDQPMLCVSAVNPFLFSKVPALLHVMGIRKKIGAMLPYVRCPFRGSIQRGLGFRRYLLEGNDFFALRDLVDLSKGAFAALPIMVETISNRIFDHITEQCLVCYDTGVPCAARRACDNPSSLIFPFQEAEAAKCGLCGSIFHKSCFAKLMGCPCAKPTSGNRSASLTEHVVGGAGINPDRVSDSYVQPSNSDLTSGFFSNILDRVRPEKLWKPKNSSPVILMGSLPSTSL